MLDDSYNTEFGGNRSSLRIRERFIGYLVSSFNVFCELRGKNIFSESFTNRIIVIIISSFL